MNYCKHLKIKFNKKTYCKLLKEETSFARCRECVNKEYRFPVKGKIENRKNVKINNKKSTIFVKNRSFLCNNAQNNQKTVQNLKNKSKKLAKLERKRFSVFFTENECMVCKSTYQLTWNEIYRGRNRINSMKYGFCLRMCLTCHKNYQDDVDFNDYWHKQGQLYFEEHYGTREDFLAIFRRNYLE